MRETDYIIFVILSVSTKGGLCTSQGTLLLVDTNVAPPLKLDRASAALSQVADVATAYFTAAIAVHTFNSLVLKFRLPLWFCFLMVSIGWAASVVIGMLSNLLSVRCS